MTVIDACTAIAFLDASDTHHARAVELLAAATDELVLHPLTAAEVLVHPTRAGVEAEVWSDLVGIGLVVDDRPIDPRQLAELRVRTSCKMPDCCVLASAVGRGDSIITFDVQLAAAAAMLGVAVIR